MKNLFLNLFEEHKDIELPAPDASTKLITKVINGASVAFLVVVAVIILAYL